MNFKTIPELARELDGALVYNEERKIHLLRDNSPEWMRDVILAVDVDTDFDSLYDAVNKLVANIGYCDAGASDDEIRDAINETESDVYTRDLTTWLAASVNHVYYLTQALEEFGCKDGFAALGLAQHLYLEEIGYGLIVALQERSDFTQELADNMAYILESLDPSDFDYVASGDTNVYPFNQ